MKRIMAIVILCCLTLTGCQATNRPDSQSNCDEKEKLVLEKPVIYLYGYDNEEVNVQLNIENGELTCTYPYYGTNGWFVKAKPDGTLIDSKGTEYNYLYWEANLNTEFDFSKGFCVKGSDTAEFLTKELAEIGLTRKEANEFIIYWLPLMEQNAYNVISFQTKTYTQAAKLTITPKPNKLLRVFMAWYPTDKEIQLTPQKFSVPKREGKVVVEWGGCSVAPNGAATADLEEEVVIENEVKPARDTSAEEKELAEKLQKLMVEQTNLKNASQAAPAGHAFTDKNGQKTTFTDAEWNKLINTWAYTGQAEEMISHHTIGELRNVLNN